MQDIAGCRVIVPTIIDQNALTDQLTKAFLEDTDFAEQQVVDRRTRPSHGYRAIHIIITCLDKKIEIQVRTEMQLRWADRGFRESR